MAMRSNLVFVLACGVVMASSGKCMADDEVEKLQGTWILDSVETKGEALPKDKIARNTVVITGERFVVMNDGKVQREVTFKIDASKNPKWIDQVFPGQDGQLVTRPGLYELNGDTLRLIFDRTRPTELKTTADSNLNITVYKRNKK
jgi:uncharacterized protein (TIGR03067 family)